MSFDIHSTPSEKYQDNQTRGPGDIVWKPLIASVTLTLCI